MKRSSSIPKCQGRNDRSKRRRGVTLFEILASVSIAAMASILSVTMLGSPGVNSGRARSSVDDLASLLRSARNTAIAKQRPVEIQIAASEDSRWVSDMVTGGAIPLTSPIIVPMVPQPGVNVRGWPGNVRFDLLGNANRSLDVYVGHAGQEYRLRMYQASGVIRVTRP